MAEAEEQPKPPNALQKQLGQIQMLLGQFTKMISDVLKQFTGLDLDVSLKQQRVPMIYKPSCFRLLLKWFRAWEKFLCKFRWQSVAW